MKSKFHKAGTFLLIGLILVLISAINLARGSRGWVVDDRRSVFMAALLIGGMLLSWKGWTRLQDLKKETPEVWREFLRLDLIAIALVGSLVGGLVGGFLMLPKETQDSITKEMHDFMEATHAIKGGHP